MDIFGDKTMYCSEMCMFLCENKYSGGRTIEELPAVSNSIHISNNCVSNVSKDFSALT